MCGHGASQDDFCAECVYEAGDDAGELFTCPHGCQFDQPCDVCDDDDYEDITQGV